MEFETIVEACLYNWLGYGNIGGRVWFIGTEEGGAEIWKQKTVSLEESLKIRQYLFRPLYVRITSIAQA